ncbi:exonuclease [Pseudomonas phage Astolliot]|nr:exonuclease [Pseudomonas phage Astolliot]
MLKMRPGTKFYGLDIETLGKDPDSVIISAAFLAFEFNEDKTFQQYVDESFYVKFSIAEQKAAGRKIDPDTLEWWKKQIPEVRKELMPTAKDVSMKEGSKQIRAYLASKGIDKNVEKNTIRFCRGQDFDIPIISHMMESVEEELPGSYWNSRDIRTFIAAASLDFTLNTIYKDDREYKTIPGFRIHDARHDIAKAVVEMKNIVRLVLGEITLEDL